MEKKEYTSPYDFEGKIPLKQAIILGLQHVLAMFVGNLTPVLYQVQLVDTLLLIKHHRFV